MVKPLTALTKKVPKMKKELVFKWTDKQEQVFKILKKQFLTAPVLVMPNQEEPFYLETDASEFASGAVLMQQQVSSFMQLSLTNLQ